MNTVISAIEIFENFFQQTDFDEPPVISMNLSSADSQYDYGMVADAIDFSWYAPYKSAVDSLISSILWAVFLWNLFKSLPGIISGYGTGYIASAKIDAHRRD